MSNEVPVEVEYKLLIKEADPLTIFDNQAKSIRQGYFDLAYINIFIYEDTEKKCFLALEHPSNEMLIVDLSKDNYQKAKKLFTKDTNNTFSLNLDEKPAVRVRKTSLFEGRDKFEITIKTKKSDFERFELDLPIKDKEAAEALFCYVKDSIVDKTRFIRRIPNSALKWEIDVFHGKNQGLVIAECEVPSINTPMPTPPASWSYSDVSNVKELMNANLAFIPFHQITNKTVASCEFKIQ